MRFSIPFLVTALVAAFILASGAGAKGPLRTAVIDHFDYRDADAELSYRRARAAGATVWRTTLHWYEVAPVEKPGDFRAEDPADPRYRWQAFDVKIRRLTAAGLEPLVTVNYPPVWAGGGFSPSPDAVEFGRFVRAAAERYSGRFGGLPRVRLWMLWNEANVNLFFSPQFDGERLVSPAAYRRLVNAGAAAVHAADPSNVVVAGGLTPFGVATGNTHGPPPLRFMRELLCMSSGRPPVPTCAETIEFDAWAHHPYTRGGPKHKAASAGDVSLGDLPAMRQLLDAAVRARRVVSAKKPEFWVTEFSWDTSPPDPNAVPIWLQARWTSEALYEMWKQDISLVAWLQLRDFPYPEFPTQAGLYFRDGIPVACDRPKQTLSAFRFPFVAYREGKRLAVWGRTPAGRPRAVTIEQISGKRWKTVARLRTDASGIFSRRVPHKVARGTFTHNLSQTRTYEAVVACDDAVSHWRLGDRGGRAVADRAGARNGEYSGGVALAAPGALRSDRDTAVTFNGTDGRASLPALSYAQTVELWLKTRASSTAAAFSNRNSDSHFVFLGVTDGGRALAHDSFPLRGSRAVNDDRWHHVVYTYDPATKTGRLYVDGALDASASWERIEGGGPVSLGYDAALQNHFAGAVDEVAVYPRPLSPVQVRNHFLASAKAIRLGAVDKLSGSYVRARSAGVSSLPFSLKREPDRPYNPFG